MTDTADALPGFTGKTIRVRFCPGDDPLRSLPVPYDVDAESRRRRNLEANGLRDPGYSIVNSRTAVSTIYRIY